MISVIIPYYNRESCINDVLASIESQTFKDIEVVIVDDGSTDPVTSIIGDFTFPLKIARQRNAGAPAARNRGFDLSYGEYVIFWDADMIGDVTMLEKMHATLEKHPEAAYAYANFKHGWKKMPARLFSAEALRKNNFITVTSLMRRNVFPRFDESLKKFQDWDLWLTLLAQGKTGVWVDEYLITAKSGGTMSSWLPSFAYKKPWKWLPRIKKIVHEYEIGKQIIMKKHGLS